MWNGFFFRWITASELLSSSTRLVTSIPSLIDKNWIPVFFQQLCLWLFNKIPSILKNPLFSLVLFILRIATPGQEFLLVQGEVSGCVNRRFLSCILAVLRVSITTTLGTGYSLGLSSERERRRWVTLLGVFHLPCFSSEHFSEMNENQLRRFHLWNYLSWWKLTNASSDSSKFRISYIYIYIYIYTWRDFWFSWCWNFIEICEWQILSHNTFCWI